MWRKRWLRKQQRVFHLHLQTRIYWKWNHLQRYSWICLYATTWAVCSWQDVVIFVSDIDECSKNGSPCDENADCLNNDGSYTCTCKDGFTGNGRVCDGKFLSAYKISLPCIIIAHFAFSLFVFFVCVCLYVAIIVVVFFCFILASVPSMLVMLMQHVEIPTANMVVPVV